MNRPLRYAALLSPQCMTHQVPPALVEPPHAATLATLESPMTVLTRADFDGTDWCQVCVDCAAERGGFEPSRPFISARWRAHERAELQCGN